MLFEVFMYNYHLTLKYISNAVIVSIQFLFVWDFFVLYILCSFYIIY